MPRQDGTSKGQHRWKIWSAGELPSHRGIRVQWFTAPQAQSSRYVFVLISSFSSLVIFWLVRAMFHACLSFRFRREVTVWTREAHQGLKSILLLGPNIFPRKGKGVSRSWLLSLSFAIKEYCQSADIAASARLIPPYLSLKHLQGYRDCQKRRFEDYVRWSAELLLKLWYFHNNLITIF